jgi:hypothetical protein
MKGYSHNAIRITSVEIGFLWNTYMIESLVHHILNYSSKHLEDQELRQLATVWLHETNDSLNLLSTLFQQEGIPVPVGITSNDIHPDAPPLFSDKFYMLYSVHMARFGLQNYSLAYSQSSRGDIRQFFKHYVDRLIIVNERITDLVTNKLMLFHINLLNSMGLGNYGMAIAASSRIDLAFLWIRIMFQAGLYGKTGTNLMVKYGWMEQPPSASERETRLDKYKIIPQPAMKPGEKHENNEDNR